MKKQIFLLFVSTLCCGCAAQHQPPSAATPTVLSQPVREEFDPQSLHEDLLLIRPTFAPPQPTAQPPVAPPEETTLPEASLPSADENLTEETVTRNVYRVQLMALSNGDIAQQRRIELEGDLGVPVRVELQRNLFMVRAGEYPTAEEAERLREQIVAFSDEYADAYVVTDQASVAQLPAVIQNEEEELPIEPAVADDSPPPVLVPAFGWRVLIDKVDSYRQAQGLKRSVTDRLRRTDIDITFKTPYYNVEVGHFRTKVEAQQALERIEGRYPNALILPTQILVPKEE